MSSKVNLNDQAEKLKSLMGSARLQTAQQASPNPAEYEGSKVVNSHIEPAKSKAKNLRAIPITYFEAHANLKAASKTSLDFSSYILEALREKLERDGALGG
jgi:hypothetical protein